MASAKILHSRETSPFIAQQNINMTEDNVTQKGMDAVAMNVVAQEKLDI